jgi:WD40 repeat protein
MRTIYPTVAGLLALALAMPVLAMDLSGASHILLVASTSLKSALELGKAQRTIINLESNSGLTKHLDQAAEVRAVAFSPDSKTLAVAGELLWGDPPVGLVLWDVETDCQKIIVKKGLSWVYSFAFSSDGKFFATGHAQGPHNEVSEEPEVRVWETSSCKLVARLKGHTARINSLSFSADGNFLASGGDDNKVILWDLGKHEKVRTVDTHSDSVGCVAFSPDGAILASASWDGRICLTNTKTGKPIGSIDGSASRTLAFSPSGKEIAAGQISENSANVTVWDLEKRERKRTFEGHRMDVWSLSYSPDGRYIARGARDGVIKLWDVETGKQHLSTRAFKSAARALSFTPDGRTIAVTGGGKVKLWDVASGNQYGVKKKED